MNDPLKLFFPRLSGLQLSTWDSCGVLDLRTRCLFELFFFLADMFYFSTLCVTLNWENISVIL